MTPSRVLGNLARGSGFRAAQSSTGKALGGRCRVACQHMGRGASRQAQFLSQDRRGGAREQGAWTQGPQAVQGLETPVKEAQAACPRAAW